MNIGAGVDMNTVTRNTQSEANERNACNCRQTGGVESIRSVLTLLDDAELLERSGKAS
jgi:hypothetical protein